MPVQLGVFGKYRLVDQLAVGGMAQVFLAQIEGPDGFTKRCVIKTILPEYAELTNFAQMFVTEAKVAALLSHPHIVQIYDFGKVDNRYYLAMEYVDGVSVEQLLRASAKRGVPLGPRVALGLALPLLDALSYIYTLVGPEGQPLELVHRDVTPGNVLVSATGVVKLTDFGVVKTAVNPSQTSAGMVKGKYAYMSPEQVRARPLDQRSDLFSLGVVLYEVATGRRLFRRNSLAETISAVNSGKVPPPSQLVPDFPSGLERILMRALNLDRDQRYRNAQEMQNDLERFRAGQMWTAGNRELAHLVDGLFPGGHRVGQSPYGKGVVPRPDTTPSGAGEHPPSIEDPIPSVVDEVDLSRSTGSMSSKRTIGPMEIGLILAGVFLLSALIWVLLLS
ncbi:MAG TPA: serine/threonine-protein kinase [Myxococcales bacterium]|nr:serine/threonine-protein kinase [Myxococcales bacterium]